MLVASGLYLAFLAGAAASSKSVLVEMGDNTYSITREAKTAFNRDTEKLKAEAEEDAAKFCTARGKQLKVVALTVERPFYTLGFSKAKIIFKALDAGDAELTREPAPIPAVNLSAAGPVSGPSGDLYTELLKLDDLRKKGILTDAEFESEKKKVLRRSK